MGKNQEGPKAAEEVNGSSWRTMASRSRTPWGHREPFGLEALAMDQKSYRRGSFQSSTSDEDMLEIAGASLDFSMADDDPPLDREMGDLQSSPTRARVPRLAPSGALSWRPVGCKRENLLKINGGREKRVVRVKDSFPNVTCWWLKLPALLLLEILSGARDGCRLGLVPLTAFGLKQRKDHWVFVAAALAPSDEQWFVVTETSVGAQRDGARFTPGRGVSWALPKVEGGGWFLRCRYRAGSSLPPHRVVEVTFGTGHVWESPPNLLTQSLK
ncbi:PREDICTED: uncharacterized protein LOC104347850 [Leptosomus discolor]|uniref:uncharacterized protein LOC104347850 n=1 Tax=Leptosomus discolor TaxID=188344 RepID=UPI0005227F4F|nr:PREDICTED: uncharacterized protein LOC104347850 [Leptosomus discolor]